MCAVDENGRLDVVDISYLTRESLLEWLRSKTPAFVENVVLEILDHPREKHET